MKLNPDTQLFGRGSKLDSLGLVNLIVLVEEKTADTFGKSVTIADERAMSQKEQPLPHGSNSRRIPFLPSKGRINA